MKVDDVICTFTGRDVVRLGRDAIHVGESGKELTVFFPDRTPRDKLEAIAKAINDALDAAREIEGAARD